MPKRDHVALYEGLISLFSKLFNFESVGIMFFDQTREQLYQINISTVYKD
jgi:hypothetical protein